MCAVGRMLQHPLLTRNGIDACFTISNGHAEIFNTLKIYYSKVPGRIYISSLKICSFFFHLKLIK